MNKTKSIIGSIFVIGVIAVLMGAGTQAYFSDTESSTGNSFTAGTMDLVLSDDNEAELDGVTATWESPSCWSPGQTVDGTLWLKNVGCVNAMTLKLDWKSLSCNDPDSDGSRLADVIIITNWEFYKVTDDTWYSWEWLLGYMDAAGNNDGETSLYELAEDPGYNPYFWECDPEDLELIIDNNGNHLPDPGDKVKTPPGAPPTCVTDIWDATRMTFKFDEDAGNIYQGDSCSFEVQVDIFNSASQELWYEGEGCGDGYA